MGAILTLSIVLWLTSSFVEYKIVRASPHLKMFFKGVPGMAISVAISLTVGLVLAPAAGVAVQLAAVMGLATNEFTFKLYSGMEAANNKRKEVTEKVSTFKSEHPRVFADAVDGIKAGVKTIAAVVLGVVWLIGLPLRICRWVSSGYANLRQRMRVPFVAHSR